MLIEFALDKNRGVVELIQEQMRVQSLKYKSKNSEDDLNEDKKHLQAQYASQNLKIPDEDIFLDKAVALNGLSPQILQVAEQKFSIKKINLVPFIDSKSINQKILN